MVLETTAEERRRNGPLRIGILQTSNCTLGVFSRFVEDPHQSILQIAMDFGYDSHAHFGQLYRSYFGLSPMAARKSKIVSAHAE